MRKGFLKWGYYLERWLINLVILGAVLVVLSQTLLVDDPLRRVTAQIGFPQDSLQGQNSLNDPNAPIVTLQLKNYSSLPRAWVIINDEPQKNFLDRYVTIAVKHEDVLEIDGTYYKHMLEVEILDTSREILSPKPGQIFKINGNSIRVGTVKLAGQEQDSDGGSR